MCMVHEKAECGAAFVLVKCLGGKGRSIRVNRRKYLQAGSQYVEISERENRNHEFMPNTAGKTEKDIMVDMASTCS